MSYTRWETVRQDDRYLIAGGVAGEIEKAADDMRGYVHDIVDTLKATEEEADFTLHAIWNIRHAHDHLDKYIPDALNHLTSLVDRLRGLMDELRPMLPENPTDRQIELSRNYYDGMDLEDFESLEAAYAFLDSVETEGTVGEEDEL